MPELPEVETVVRTLENQIKNTFSEEEKKLANLKQEIQIENDADTKSKKESEIQKL